jgi:hypothetical protein
MRYSYRHLLTLNRNISSILGSSDGLSSWEIDVRGNRVVVHVLPVRIEEARRIFMEANPDDVVVEPGGPVLTM